MKLTIKQKRFCDYYIQSGNATEAAIKAGYSKKTSYSIGSENLNKPEILDYIETRNKELSNKRIADMQEIKEFWTNTIRSSNLDYKDRLKASEYIAKTNAAFVDRKEVEAELNVTKLEEFF